MKNLIIAFTFLIGWASNISGQDLATVAPEWKHDFEEAKKMASELKRPILMSFAGSDWCVPCIRLDKEFFNTKEFISFADNNLVLLRLDFPSRKKNQLPTSQVVHNEALAEKYNKKGAFPLVLLVDDKGAVMGKMNHPSHTITAYLNSIQSLIN